MAMEGKRVIETAVKELPDLITLDIRQPEMNGLEVERCVRQNSETHALPILAMTTNFTLQEQQLCLQSGCDKYNSRVFTYSVLCSHIEGLLG